MSPRLTIVRRAAAESARVGGLRCREQVGRHQQCYCTAVIICFTISPHQKMESPENRKKSSGREADLMNEANLCSYSSGQGKNKGSHPYFSQQCFYTLDQCLLFGHHFNR